LLDLADGLQWCNHVIMTKGSTAEIEAWFVGRLPDEWFTGPPEVRADRDEILVVGEVAEPEVGADAGDDARRAAQLARIKRFREDTRDQRIRIASEAEILYDRKVSWGARCGGTDTVFTNLGVPVMTRLRLRERQVLDTLIDSGVARSRSEALAWCVRLVGRHQSDWIAQLREAVQRVDEVRADGPDLG
jgi:hypothetical protein